MANQREKTRYVAIVDEFGLVADVHFIDGHNRLAVDIEGTTFQLQPFVPKLSLDSTGVTLNTSTYTTLLNITSTAGKLDFIAIGGSSAAYRVRLTIDALEVYDITMADLNAIGLANATNVAIWAETANKNFRYHPKVQVDFTDSLLVEAKATAATPLIKTIITYRTES